MPDATRLARSLDAVQELRLAQDSGMTICVTPAGSSWHAVDAIAMPVGGGPSSNRGPCSAADAVRLWADHAVAAMPSSQAGTGVR